MADRVRRSANPLLYLYGITPKRQTLPSMLRGVDGISFVEPFDCAGFTCWTSRVDPVQFGENLTHNMGNLEWLAEASVRHQRVVGAIHEKQSILPARFGTVFRSEESLCEDVSAREAALKASFRRIAGADEWGVRVFAAPSPAKSVGQARSGREYLKKKSALLQAKAARSLEPEISRFAAAIGKLAIASAEGGKVGSGQPGLRWQSSLLLPRNRRAKFASLLGRFASKWQESFRVECTGPWPPYSFVGETAQARPPEAARSGAAR